MSRQALSMQWEKSPGKLPMNTDDGYAAHRTAAAATIRAQRRFRVVGSAPAPLLSIEMGLLVVPAAGGDILNSARIVFPGAGRGPGVMWVRLATHIPFSANPELVDEDYSAGLCCGTQRENISRTRGGSSPVFLLEA